MAMPLPTERQDLHAIAEDDGLVCSRERARKLIGRLVIGVETQPGLDRSWYIFSAEKRRVRIRQVRIPDPPATGS
jgi:hypothetical protein